MCIDMRLDMRMDMHAQYSLMHARYPRTTCSRMQPRRAGSAEQAEHKIECRGARGDGLNNDRNDTVESIVMILRTAG